MYIGIPFSIVSTFLPFLRQQWQKKAKTTKVCAFVEAKPFGVEKSYLQFWMRTNLKI